MCYIMRLLRTMPEHLSVPNSDHVLVTFNADEYSIKIDQSGIRKWWHLFANRTFIC